MARYEAMAEAGRIAEGRMGLFLEALQDKAERREAAERAAREAVARDEAQAHVEAKQPEQE